MHDDAPEIDDGTRRIPLGRSDYFATVDADGLIAECVRLCVRDGAPRNACSFLYGAARRVWQTMGGARLITYTLQSESGASLRGAGFVEEARYQPSGRHESGWGSRGREYRPIYDEPKIRWGSV